MKHAIFFLLILVCPAILFGQDTLPKADTMLEKETLAIEKKPVTLQEANDLYIKGQYAEASIAYEEILKENGGSSVVYYNLGNAYYKSNDIGPAILNYERALLLDPGDSDIRFNLEMAKLKTVDKIEPLGDFFLVDWKNTIRDLFNTNEWSRIGMAAFIVLIACLVLFFFSRKILLKKMGFYAGITCLVLTIISNIFSYEQKKKLTDRREAIIFVPTVTLKGSPDKSGTDIVILHEGTKVFVKSKLGEWNEVVLEDGNIGWIENNMIEMI